MAKKNTCSFCGRSADDVMLLINGINGFICEDCSRQAYEIAQQAGVYAGSQKGAADEMVAEIPKPMEIKARLDEYVIGQDEAKRTLAVAVYNLQTTATA